MAKGEQKDLKNQIKDDRIASQETFDQVYKPMQQSYSDVASRAGQEREAVRSGYQNAADTGYMSDDLATRIRNAAKTNPALAGAASSGGGGGGSSSTTKTVNPNTKFTGFGDSKSKFQNLWDTGGVDTTGMSEALQYYKPIAEKGFDDTAVRADVNRLSNYGITGGLSDAELQNWRNSGAGYGEFAKTGGYSDTDVRNFRAQASAPVAATYSNLASNLNRMNAVQGGYNPGFGRSAQSLARQGAQQMGAQALSAENTLQNNIRKGRKWGIEGQSGMEKDINSLLSGNRISASGAAANAGTNLEQALVNAKLGGAQGIETTNKDIQSLLQQGKISGSTGLFNIENALNQRDIAEKNRAASSAAASAAQSLAERRFQTDTEQWLADYESKNKLAGLGGLDSLYTQNSGELGNLQSNLMGMYGSQAGVNQGYLNNQYQMASMPGVTDKIMGGIGSVGGLMSNFGGGGGSSVTSGQNTGNQRLLQSDDRWQTSLNGQDWGTAW